MAEERSGSQGNSQERGTRSPVSTPPESETAAATSAKPHVPSWEEKFPNGVGQSDDLADRQEYILLRLHDVQRAMDTALDQIMSDTRWQSENSQVLGAIKFQVNAMSGMFKARMRSVEVEAKMLGVDKISERAKSDDPAMKVKAAMERFAEEEAGEKNEDPG